MFVWFCTWWVVLTVACLCVGRWVKRQRRQPEQPGDFYAAPIVFDEAIIRNAVLFGKAFGRVGVTCEEAMRGLGIPKAMLNGPSNYSSAGKAKR